jgi:tol-pal system protein YbgF
MTLRFLLAPIAAVTLFATLPARAQDVADLLVRTTRLEGQVRQLQGQLEQLQFQNRKLEEQLKKFQEDVEYRFQERAGPAPKPVATPQIAPSAPVHGLNPAAPKLPAAGQKRSDVFDPAAPSTATGLKRGDAFDPSAQPNAPGAPRNLGTLPGSPGGAPLPPSTIPAPRAALPGPPPDQIGGLIEGADTPMDGGNAGPLDLSASAKAGTGPGVPSAGPGVVATGPLPPPATGSLGAPAGTADGPDEYEAAYSLVLNRRYDQAEMAFRSFLTGHPKDRMVPNALYWLGESYLQRKQYEDAAEQYLKIYQSHSQSKVAPDGLVKLAVALRGMGQKEQACATLAEVTRKYPQSSGEVRMSVEREQKITACGNP